LCAVIACANLDGTLSSGARSHEFDAYQSVLTGVIHVSGCAADLLQAVSLRHPHLPPRLRPYYVDSVSGSDGNSGARPSMEDDSKGDEFSRRRLFVNIKGGTYHETNPNVSGTVGNYSRFNPRLYGVASDGTDGAPLEPTDIKRAGDQVILITLTSERLRPIARHS
jgi:hypothetical protein